MENTANLALPYIMPAQAQKHVTHNEALGMLDALVQLSAHDRDRTEPPSAPEDGDRHIVGVDAEGPWEGRDGHIAAWQDGAWAYFQPAEGWRAWVAGEDALLVFHDGQWAPIGGALQNLDMVGVNATADAVNRLAVSSEAVLLDHDGEGHQLKINKDAPGDTASVLFQTDYSGCAEMGLAGDDNYHFKVSPDGESWSEAIVIDRATGAVSFPNTALEGGGGAARELLDAPRTYYVRDDGDDGNDGLADSAGGAFATIQKAVDTVASLDLGVYDATIQIGDGTWSQPVQLKTLTGAGAVNLVGNTGTPSAVTLNSSTETGIIYGFFRGLYRLRGVRLQTASGAAIRCEGFGGQIEVDGPVEFGGATTAHVFAGDGGSVHLNAPYAVDGGASAHLRAIRSGIVIIRTGVTITGTPSFSLAFARAEVLGLVQRLSGASFTGAASGLRYQALGNGVINTGGQGASFFPGSTEGETDTGGQYL